MAPDIPGVCGIADIPGICGIADIPGICGIADIPGICGIADAPILPAPPVGLSSPCALLAPAPNAERLLLTDPPSAESVPIALDEVGIVAKGFAPCAWPELAAAIALEPR